MAHHKLALPLVNWVAAAAQAGALWLVGYVAVFAVDLLWLFSSGAALLPAAAILGVLLLVLTLVTPGEGRRRTATEISNQPR